MPQVVCHKQVETAQGSGLPEGQRKGAEAAAAGPRCRGALTSFASAVWLTPVPRLLRFACLQERAAALAKYGDVASDSNTFEPGEGIPEAAHQEDEAAEEEETGKQSGPTPEQLMAIQAAIANAQTLEEVTMLEEALATGVMPSGLDLGGASNGNGVAQMDED